MDNISSHELGIGDDARKDFLQQQVMSKSMLDLSGEEQLLGEIDADNKRLIGQGYYRLAKVYYDKADLIHAEEYFLKALEKCEFPKDVFAMFKVCGFLVRIYSEALKEEQAEKYIHLSEELIEKLSFELGTLSAEYFFYAGVIRSYRGNFLDAKESYMLAYKKAQEENEPELVAKSLYSLATNSYNRGEMEESLRYLGQLSELLSILKKGYLKGSMHILYGQIYTALDNFSEALRNYQLATKELRHKTCWNLYCYILMGQGIVLKKMGEFSKALIYFDLALHSINESKFKRLAQKIHAQVQDVNDSSVDLFLDRHNRVIYEKEMGKIDFKHRFVLLEILFLLAKNPGSSYNKEDLAKSIWKDEYNPLIHDKLIYTSISRLRKLIEPTDEKNKYILRGKDGYTFNPRVNARFYQESDNNNFHNIGNVELNSPV